MHNVWYTVITGKCPHNTEILIIVSGLKLFLPTQHLGSVMKTVCCPVRHPLIPFSMIVGHIVTWNKQPLLLLAVPTSLRSSTYVPVNENLPEVMCGTSR